MLKPENTGEKMGAADDAARDEESGATFENDGALAELIDGTDDIVTGLFELTG